ncbi:MAG: methyltransferase [Bryobacteraceae bacterium]
MDLWSLSDLATPWCVHVVATLDIAAHIDHGRAQISEIAEACGADPDSLLRVMRHLIEKGLFEEPEPGRFALNDLARGLLSPGTRLGLNLDGFGGRMAHAWGTMLEAVRTGKPAYSQAFGRDYWRDLEAHPEIAAQFDALMGPAGHGTPDPRVLIDASDWKEVRTVVDVGGGTGSLLAEVLRAQPHVRGILVDLPRTAARSRPIFEAAGVTERVSVSAQSFFDPLPAGHDVYTLNKVLGDWPDHDAELLLRRCADAARPHGRVLVLNGVTPGEVAPPELLMMVLVGGKERTLDEFRGLAAKAGLAVHQTERQESGRFIVECRPQP